MTSRRRTNRENRDDPLTELKSVSVAEISKRMSSGSKYDDLTVTDEKLQAMAAEFLPDVQDESDEDYETAPFASPAVTVVSTGDHNLGDQDPFAPEKFDIDKANNMTTPEESRALKKAKEQIRLTDPREISIFLYGYRMKQDYINIALGGLTQGMERNAAKIGTMVHTLNSAVTNLSVGVDHALHAVSGKMESILLWEKGIPKESDAQRSVRTVSPIITEVRTHPEETVEKKLERVRTANEKRTLTTVIPHWTSAEISKFLGMPMETILGYYEISLERLVQVFLDTGETPDSIKEKMGARAQSAVLSLIMEASRQE